MNSIIIFCGLLFYLHYQINQCHSKSITYLNAERPVVDWFDRTYCKNITCISRRISRQDPRHYVDLYMHILQPINNSFTLDFYFYQFLTNRYKPSFVELHFKVCDMVDSDSVFASFVARELRKGAGGRDCPYPAGMYHLKNMSLPNVPKGFPFTKGRIYINVSVTLGGVTKMIGSGSIDMEIKVAHIKNN